MRRVLKLKESSFILEKTVDKVFMVLIINDASHRLMLIIKVAYDLVSKISPHAHLLPPYLTRLAQRQLVMQ